MIQPIMKLRWPRGRTIRFRVDGLFGMAWGWIAVWLVATGGVSLAEGLPTVVPESCRMDSDRLAEIDWLAAEGIRERKMPGCVICVGRHGKIVHFKAYGNKRVEPTIEAMTVDTVFDMASITKPVATATGLMRLIEEGKVGLSDTIASYFPSFAKHGKDIITVQHLLVHQSGLIPDNPLSDYQDGEERAWECICDLKPIAPIGSAFKYSDVNFIILGKLIEKVSGKELHDYVRETIFRPLGMKATGYLPDASLRQRSAPTEMREGEWIQGEVHDPRAFAMKGVAGHAGLFSTAEDLAIYAQMMLGKGEFRGGSSPTRILSPQTVAAMTTGYPIPGGLRGLGWDKRSSYSSNRGNLFSSTAFGHGGFTGTVLWIDPELDCFFIFLSNRVHPDGKGSINPLAGRIANVIASSIQDASRNERSRGSSVMTGIDVLERQAFRELAGQRIGLITNHTGRNQAGVSTVQLLSRSKEVQLRVLFSPEHGFEGKLDVAKVSDSSDQETGLKIYSLYGETRRPTKSMLDDIDTLVFDIQDIGARFYTYLSTMGEAMVAAAEHGRKFVVLDRPNPINGLTVTGPMLDAGSESFVGFVRLPVRHGMTAGEIAKLIRHDRKLDLSLTIIPCEGWSRSDYWDATGLTWINPSPNMRSLTQALLYPGIGLLEMTNLSVGRGTDTPFELIGAPWMEGRMVAQQMNARRLGGVSFVPIEFTPTTSKFVNERCSGVNVIVTNRERIEPVRVGLELAKVFHELYPSQWETKNLNRLLGNQTVLQAILDGSPSTVIEQAIGEGVDDFLRRRSECLIY